MKPNIAVVLDTRRPKTGGKYPAKLRATYNRKQKYYPLGIDLTKEEYANIQSRKPSKEMKEIKIKLMEYEAKANRIIEKIPDFSFAVFERKLFERSKNSDNIFPFYEEKIKKLREAGLMGTAYSYQCAMNSLKKFSPRIGFKDIDTLFLKRYERFMISSGNSITTVGIYLRTLRAIFNDAISEEVISKEYFYPFGKRLYQIPTSRNIKKALDIKEIKEIFHFKLFVTESEEKAVDFWRLSYLCNGMNMTDIAHLKYKNIDGDFIKFRREKTKETNRGEGKVISVFISDPVKDIIKKWGNVRSQENFIFPIISDAISEEKKRFLIQQFIKQVNKYMKRLSTRLGIDKPITTYYARHSYATVLKRSGANVEYISESLGHSSVITTSNYLDSFEDDWKKEMAKKLIAF
jgi:integrase/recombinase XerD